MHGAQPNANVTPKGNADRGPGRTRPINRRFLYRIGSRTTPIIDSPITTMKTPAPRVITGTLRSNTDPTRANDTPSNVNTTVKPATKNSAAPSATRRDCRWSSASIGSPEMNDTYPGSRERQHGELNEIAPATSARSGIA